jgi:hypothetical protein
MEYLSFLDTIHPRSTIPAENGVLQSSLEGIYIANCYIGWTFEYLKEY